MTSVSIQKSPSLLTSVSSADATGQVFGHPVGIENSGRLFDDSKSLSDYVLVKKSGKPAISSVVKPELPPGLEKPSLGTSAVAVKVQRPAFKVLQGTSRHNEIGITLVDSTNASSSAVSAQAISYAIIPGRSSEFTNLATMYEEFIMDSVDVFFNTSVLNTNTADVDFAISYEPLNSTPPSSVSNVLESSQFDGPFQVGLTARAVSPTSVTRTGFASKHFTCPKGPSVLDPATVTISGTGQWTSTAVATTAYGYLKGYVTAPSTGFTNVGIYLRMHCRFRSRR
jgi:hypothetical protein